MTKAIGTDAASVNVHSSGMRTSRRWSATASRAKPSTTPITRSPTASVVTSSATSVTTPAPSPPMGASPGYMSRAISTSRKFSPIARVAILTSPGARGGLSAGSSARLSTVPRPFTSSRQLPVPAGGTSAVPRPDPARASLGTYAVPSRSASWFSPPASTAGSAR